MADTYIDFLFDPATLTSAQQGQLPGSFDNPVAVDHPPLRYKRDTDTDWTTQPNPDYAVPVQTDSRVFITVSCSNPKLAYVMAPDRFLPIYWTQIVDHVAQARQDCTSALLNNSMTAPFNTPQFDVDHPTNHTLAYKDQATGWQPNSAYFNQYIPKDCVNTSRPVVTSQPAIYAPHLSFGVVDLAGKLDYGLQVRIAAATNGKDLGWVYWDPSIQVVSSGQNFALLPRKR